MRTVCCCQLGAEGEAGAGAGHGGPEDNKGRAYGRARSGRPGIPGHGLQGEGEGWHRAGHGPSAGAGWSGGHSPCRHRLQPAAPPGTGPPPGPWAAAGPVGGGSPHCQSPGRKAGKVKVSEQDQPKSATVLERGPHRWCSCPPRFLLRADRESTGVAARGHLPQRAGSVGGGVPAP